MTSTHCAGPRLSADRDIAIVIPARNEQARIASCLSALSAQDPRLSERVFIVVIANNCTDATVQRALVAAAQFTVPLRLYHYWCSDGGVGLARQVGCKISLDLQPALRFLLTTDADSRVAQDWLEKNIAHLAATDAVCGTIIADPKEAARLASRVYRNGAMERSYMQATFEFENLLRGVTPDRWSRFGAPGGASLGFRTAAYRAVGGFTALTCGEDRDIVRRMKRMGCGVITAGDVLVVTSCRLDGRAPGGMAATLALRTRARESFADEDLRSAHVLAARALGTMGAQRCGQQNLHAEGRRLKLSALPAEIATLRGLIATLRNSRPEQCAQSLRAILSRPGAKIVAPLPRWVADSNDGIEEFRSMQRCGRSTRPSSVADSDELTE